MVYTSAWSAGRPADGRTSRLSPVGVGAWSGASGYPAGAVVTSAGDLHRPAHAVDAGGPAPADATDGSWAPL